MDITLNDLQAALTARYEKNFIDKLAKTRVCIAGLGGLGSNAAVFLARSGIMNLHIIDFDYVDISNINRQQYFLNHIGIKKTDALTDILRNINPYINIKSDFLKIDCENLPYIFENDDYVIEAFDCPESKAMLVNDFFTYYKRQTLICASGMAGIGESNLIKTRKLNDRLYICGDQITGTESEGTISAARAAICAGHEANIVLELIKKETF